MRQSRLTAIGIILVSSLLLSFLFTYMLYSSKDHPAWAGDTVEPAAEAPVDAGGGAVGAPSQGFAAVVDKAGPAVVYIEVTKTVDLPGRGYGQPFGGDPFFDFFFGNPFGGQGPYGGQGRARKHEQRGLGSGFIVDKERGWVLTNNHVIEGADEIEVTLASGDKLKAKVVGSDPKTDVGLIELKDFSKRHLTEIALADSDDIRVGDWVLAIGNPFGLKQTVTAGIISAKGRANVNIAEYEDFIQTDAAINPGNSGGPLVNLRGEAIGMNTAIFSQSGGYMGIGFAVPANMLKSVMTQLATGGTIERGQIGVLIQDLTDELKTHFDYRGEGGALVSEVMENGPADKGGLKAGDVIVAIGGKPMKDVAQVKNTIGFTKVGTALAVEVWREGTRRTLSVTVGGEKGSAPAARKETEDRLGLAVSSAKDKPNASTTHGVLVEEVDPQGLAAFSGVRPGDVVLEVNRQKIEDADAFYDKVAEARDAKTILFLIDRRGHRIFLLVRNR